jgi:broad specificity phosphatase PhoE
MKSANFRRRSSVVRIRFIMPVLYYIRHGETDWNAEQRLQGHRDTNLNARGRAQAAHCGALLRDLFARDGRAAADCGYVSSPLMRARQTMEIIRAAVDLDPRDYSLDSRLTEISFGAWEGFTLDEIKQRSPQQLVERDRDKWGFSPPGGESYRDVTLRIADWYASLSRDMVVAAHGGVARALIVYLNILTPEEATRANIVHGVVYVFAGVTMARYT